MEAATSPPGFGAFNWRDVGEVWTKAANDANHDLAALAAALAVAEAKLGRPFSAPETEAKP